MDKNFLCITITSEDLCYGFFAPYAPYSVCKKKVLNGYASVHAFSTLDLFPEKNSSALKILFLSEAVLLIY